MNTPSIVIWRFLDGKAGHENQTAGLVQALQGVQPVEVRDLPVVDGLWRYLRQSLPDATAPAPDLLLGAGHATHLPLLLTQIIKGGRTVLLMRPTMPRRWFDLCIIPAHDEPKAADNVVVTRGVLNRIRPGVAKDPRKGLILIGGPSRHHQWSNAAIIGQIAEIVANTPKQRWLLTTSRRTPAGFVDALRAAVATDALEIVPAEQTGPDWLPAQLAWAGTVWVSADSVSMIYESLTAGAAVGLLDVEPRIRDRVVIGVEALQSEGLVLSFKDWMTGRELRPPKQPFNEAARCAREIVQRWFSSD